MGMVRAIVRGGRIEVGAPAEWADGTEVLVEVTPLRTGRIGIDESQWRDDPEALADWNSWIKRIEPMERVPEEPADPDRFEAEFRRYNVEAVREQMEGKSSG